MPLPPFPEDVSCYTLITVDYQKLVEGDAAEVEKLWQAATTIGFWYLNNHGAGADVEEMFAMGVETMSLPLEEKMPFEQGDKGVSYGYKNTGANVVDEFGNVDTIELVNISQADALAWPETVYKKYPRTVNASMESTVRPFMERSGMINTTVLKIFERRLGLPEGELLKKHSGGGFSSNEARVNRCPPCAPGDDKRVAFGSHTDFGSLSFLHNRLGGLQVMVPGTKEWQYVKPLPGHAICNIGDALAIFSGGVLKSNLYRVIQPPGEQNKHTRWSLVFFTRPMNSMILEPMANMSELIAEATRKPENARFQIGGVTAGEWFTRRLSSQRVTNQKGVETWRAGRGTEHLVSAY